MLAIGLKNGNIDFLNNNTFEKCYCLKAHSRKIISICFSPCGRYLASCSFDNTIKIWDCVNNFQILNIIILNSNADKLCFSPDCRYLASVSYLYSIIKIYDCTDNYNIITYFNINYTSTFCMCFSPDGSKILYGCGNNINILSIFKYSIWNFINTIIYSHAYCISVLRFSTDGNYLVSGFFDGQFIVFDLNYKKLFTFVDKRLPISDICFSKDSKYLASLFACDSTIILWDLKNNFQKLQTFDIKGVITSIHFSEDSKYLVFGFNNTITILDCENNFIELSILKLKNMDTIVLISFQPEQDVYLLK